MSETPQAPKMGRRTFMEAAAKTAAAIATGAAYKGPPKEPSIAMDKAREKILGDKRFKERVLDSFRLIRELKARRQEEKADRLASSLRNYIHQEFTALGIPLEGERPIGVSQWPWWGSNGRPINPDLNSDGNVDIADLARIGARYSQTDHDGTQIDIALLTMTAARFDDRVNYRQLRKLLGEGKFFDQDVVKGAKFVVYPGELTLNPETPMYSLMPGIRPENFCNVVSHTRIVKVVKPIIVHSGVNPMTSIEGKALAFVGTKSDPEPFRLGALNGLFVPLGYDPGSDTKMRSPRFLIQEEDQLVNFLSQHEDLFDKPNYQITSIDKRPGQRLIHGKDFVTGDKPSMIAWCHFSSE